MNKGPSFVLGDLGHSQDTFAATTNQVLLILLSVSAMLEGRQSGSGTDN